MNLRFIKRIFYSFVIFMFLLSPLVFGRDIQYEAEVRNGYSKDNYTIRWTNFVKAFSQYSEPYNNESDLISASVLKNAGGPAYYKTNGIIFHKAPLSYYAGINNSQGNGWMSTAYDYGNFPPFSTSDNIVDLEAYNSRINIGRTWISGRMSDDEINNSEIITVDSWNNVHNGYDVYNVKGTTNNWFTINTFELNHKATEDLYQKSSGSSEVYFSNILNTTFGTGGSYKTAYDFYKNMKSSWAPKNYGYNLGDNANYFDNKTNEDLELIKGQSVLNNYDNKLIIPSVKGRKVYVSHQIENSNEIMVGVQNQVAYEYNDETGNYDKSISNLYSVADENHWQESYESKNKVRVYSAQNGGSEVTYNGKKYKLVRSRGYFMTNSIDWNIPTYKGEEKDYSLTIDATNQDYGIIFEYKEVKDEEYDIEVYVNYIDKSTMSSVEDFKSSLDGDKLGDLKNKDSDRTPYIQKFVMKENGSGTIKVKDQIFKKREILTYGNKKYEYAGYKTAYGSTFLEAQLLGDWRAALEPNQNYSGISIKNVGEKRTYIVSFYFIPSNRSGGGSPNDEDGLLSDLSVKGRLDFINKNNFRNATYDHNKKDEDRSGKEMDYIPATEQLSPYIYGVQPYFIKGIKYSTVENVISANKTINWSWVEYKGHNSGCSPECNSDHSVTHRGSYTYTVTAPYEYNKIDQLIMYRISKVNIIDSNSNIGGKLFEGNVENISVSQAYNNRSKASIVGHSAELVLNSRSNHYSCAGGDPTMSEVARNVGLTATMTVSNEYIKLDGSENLVDKNKVSTTVNINGDTKLQTVKSSTNKYIDNIDKYMKGENKLTTFEDFNYENNLKTVANIPNGIRQLKGTIEYKKEQVVGNAGNVKLNKVLKSSNGSNVIEKDQTLNYSKLSDKFSHTYDNGEDPINNNDEVRRVNVTTPLSITAKIANNNNFVNHSDKSGSILQTGKEFELNIEPKNFIKSYYYNVSTSKYIKGFYVTFDFSFKLTNSSPIISQYDRVTGEFVEKRKGDKIEANTDTYIEGQNATIKGIPEDIRGENSIWSASNNIKVVAITNTISNTKLSEVFHSTKSINIGDFNNDYSAFYKRTNSLGNFFKYDNYIETSSTTNFVTGNKTLTLQSKHNLLGIPNLYAAANHAVSTNVVTNNVGRIFGFRVTDCNDLSFKNVFRDNKVDQNSVNKHNDKAYYSGVFDLKNGNFIEMVKNLNIGSNVLPLGPYKNTDNTNIFAPKLGYRISFDLQTTGYMKAGSNRNDIKVVQITPHYYYVSKDGSKKILPTLNNDGNIDDKIKLYYKSSNGKYIEISNYSIYFKPNDGYRMGIDSTAEQLSKALNKLYIKMLKLNKNMMQFEEGNYVQRWFGEFKLPNSTIAINTSGDSTIGHNTVNDPLTDGYIGVIFDIKSIEKTDSGEKIEISYNQNNTNAENPENTSQWDYEGYLGVTAGSSYSTRIQLEKGNWIINNEDYKKIKGTVLLYDIDNRAANDFN